MKTLALLIDGDNAQLSTIHHIIQFCQSYGTLEIKKAYGDWEKPPLSSHFQKITELGIDLVPQNRVTPNATDFRLAMDVAVMLDKKKADIYFLVSSDNHFTVMCEQIRQKGAQVIGIGSKNSVSSKLRKACNRFYNFEKIVEDQSKESVNISPSPQSKATPKSATTSQPKAKPKVPKAVKAQIEHSIKAAIDSKPKKQPKPKAEAKPVAASKAKTVSKVKPAPNPKPEPDPVAMLEILINTYQNAPQKEGWVNLAQLGDVRRQLKHKFGQGFASKPLSTWFKIFPHKFEVESNRIHMK